MIDEKYLAGRTASHLINAMKIAETNVHRLSEKEVSFFGTDYRFDVTENEVDVRVERIDLDEKENFNRFLQDTQKENFWKKDFLSYLKKQKDKYGKFLKKVGLEINGNYNYHFKIELKTKNEDDAFFAVFYNSVRVANLYNDPRLRQ